MGTFRGPMSCDAGVAAVLDPVDQDHPACFLVDELAAAAAPQRRGLGGGSSEEDNRSSREGKATADVVQKNSERG